MGPSLFLHYSHIPKGWIEPTFVQKHRFYVQKHLSYLQLHWSLPGTKIAIIFSKIGLEQFWFKTASQPPKVGQDLTHPKTLTIFSKNGMDLTWFKTTTLSQEVGLDQLWSQNSNPIPRNWSESFVFTFCFYFCVQFFFFRISVTQSL